MRCLVRHHIDKCRIGTGIMANQRIEARTILGGENGRDGTIVRRVRAKPIDRFGTECDQRTASQQCGGPSNVQCIWLQQFRHHRISYPQERGMAKPVRTATVGRRRIASGIPRGVSPPCSTLRSPSQLCRSPAPSCLLMGEGEMPSGVWQQADEATGGAIARALAAAEFKGGKGKTCTILAPGAGLSRVVAVGIGKPAELTAHVLNEAGGARRGARRGASHPPPSPPAHCSRRRPPKWRWALCCARIVSTGIAPRKSLRTSRSLPS